MTVPFERKNAVVWTQDFLLDLTNPKKTPRVPKEVRQRALHLLRHYPSEWDMKMAAMIEDQDPAEAVPLCYKVFSNKF